MTRRGRAVAVLVLLAGWAGLACGVEPLTSAFEAELARAKSLRLEGYPEIYYLGLTVSDTTLFDQRCSLGGVLNETRYAHRILTPSLRVGSYELDNHPVSGGPAHWGRMIARSDDEFALRHALWRVMDEFYKDASAALLRKQALRVTRGKAEYDTDDLTREEPRVQRGVPSARQGAEGLLDSLCRRTSAVFREVPDLLYSESQATWQRQWSRLLDTEGRRVEFGRDIAEIEFAAVAITSDGMKLSGRRHFMAPEPGALPGPEELEAEARGLLRELAELKVARTTSPLSTPALVDPSVAAALVWSLSGRLSGEEMRNPSGTQIFREKLGTRVLPEDLSLADDPTAESFGGRALAGHYLLDDQGIPARRVALIEGGVLKGYLLSRYPVIGFRRSNGHGRAAPGYEPVGFPGNLFLTSARSSSAGELLHKLARETSRRGKPYGLWVRRLRSFTQRQSAGGQDSIRLTGLVYQVDPRTLKATLLRDLDVVGTPLVLMSQILAAGRDAEAANMLMSGIPVSVVAPSLLVADLELQRSETKPEKLPILPAPGVSGAGVPPP